MSLRITVSTLFILILLGTSSLYAQDASCRASEQELKVYFESIYRTGEVPRMDVVENAWTSCPQPSSMMKLLYYYFQSAYALSHKAGNARMSYMDANYLYELSLRESSALTSLPKEEEPFAKLYTQRAKWLDGQIAQRGNTLGYRSRGAGASRAASAPGSEAGGWQKTTLEVPQSVNASSSSPNLRSAKPNERAFDKRYLYEGVYQETPWEEQEADPMLNPWHRPRAIENKREPYGIVGDISSLNIMAYLAFKSEEPPASAPQYGNVGNLSTLRTDRSSTRTTRTATSRSTTAPVYVPSYGVYSGESELHSSKPVPHADGTFSGVSEVAKTTRMATVPTAGQTRGGARTQSVPRSAPTRAALPPTGTNYTSLYDPLAIRSAPSFNASYIAIAAFGETLVPVPGEREISGNGVYYVKVRNQLGQEGWVEKSALIPGARLATVLRGTTAYSSPQAQATQIACYPAQLVILADIRGNWVQGFTAHGEQEIWFSSIDALSITPNDVSIAHAYQEAKKLSLMQSRKKEMMDIRNMPGYAQSPLRGIVETYIQGM